MAQAAVVATKEQCQLAADARQEDLVLRGMMPQHAVSVTSASILGPAAMNSKLVSAKAYGESLKTRKETEDVIRALHVPSCGLYEIDETEKGTGIRDKVAKQMSY
eukprot:CAMPEP_0172408314 /NCGR_PEP_ID=MMETSP1061-20121228/75788_1 /TAXON_ID=37318 /ORGANISM="Pseudo-nitzschia pungens, Strain cf. pungens" /LENGTH=104 /DNA_ID=CAMNT_0013144439 /DNA_START=614 /DNA_END=929 /DNA_ORIENTATION=-